MPDPTLFAKLLRNAIERSGQTQREVAEKSGFVHSLIGAWLTDKNKPDPDKLERVILALDLADSDASTLRAAAAQAYVPESLARRLEASAHARTLITLEAALDALEELQASLSSSDADAVRARLERLPFADLIAEAWKYASANHALLRENARLRSAEGLGEPRAGAGA